MRSALLHCYGLVMLLTVLTAVACGDASEAVSPTPTSTPLSTVSTVTTTSTPVETPTPAQSAALEALLVPGATMPAPATIFFYADGNLWKLPPDSPASPVTDGLRIGPWVQTVDGMRAAAVVRNAVDGGETEDIRLIGLDGTVSEPVYGPITVIGEDATPRISEMDWSWDSTRLAVGFSNGQVLMLRFDGDPFTNKPTVSEVAMPRAAAGIAEIAWAPSGKGITYLAGADRPTTLHVTAEGDEARPVISADDRVRYTRSFTWLPGRGRIAFAEGAGESLHVPSSIFTVAPDGSALELLLSAGRFGPASSIGALSASPDGVSLAFTVETPDEQGRPAFESLWIMNIDSREIQQVPVEAGYRVTDLSWCAAGLVWKGMPAGRDASDGAAGEVILARFDSAAGISTVVFHSS